MATNWSGRIVLSAVVIGLAALFTNPEPALDLFGGRIALKENTAYLNHGSLNAEKCWTEPAGQACEDVRIHHASSTAFLACGYPETRAVFYPPTGSLDKTSAKTYREYFLKYDIKKNVTSLLQINGLDESYDLILHGLDIWAPKDDKSLIYIFAVNHHRDGEAIILFSHKIGSDSLDFVREFKHSMIRTPNAVAAIGQSSFYITNDHYFYSGILRDFEGKYGPFTWATDVVYCDAADGGSLDCKKVTSSQPGANGAVLAEDGKLLAVNDVLEGSTSLYTVDQETKALTFIKKIILGAHCDNISEIPGSGDLLVSVFPDFHGLMSRLHNPLNATLHAQAAALRLVKSKGYAPELLYWDDGSRMSILTGSAVDPYNHRFIAGSVVDRQFVVCDISHVSL